jgi:hypothetical protein
LELGFSLIAAINFYCLLTGTSDGENGINDYDIETTRSICNLFEIESTEISDSDYDSSLMTISETSHHLMCEQSFWY